MLVHLLYLMFLERVVIVSRYLFIVFTFTGYGTTHKVNNVVIQMNGNFSNEEQALILQLLKEHVVLSIHLILQAVMKLL